MREELRGADSRVTGNGAERLLVTRGHVLVYIVPFYQERPGRRLFLADCMEGTAIPGLFYTDDEEICYRLLLAAGDDSAEIEILPDPDPVQTGNAFARLTGIPHVERIGYEEALAERYRMHQVREDATIYRVDKDNRFYEEQGQREIDHRFGKKTASPSKKSGNPLYLALCRICREQGIPQPDPVDAGAGQGKNLPVPQILDRSGLIWRRIADPGLLSAGPESYLGLDTENRPMIVRVKGRGSCALYDPTDGRVLWQGAEASGRVSALYEIIPSLPEPVRGADDLRTYVRSRLRPHRGSTLRCGEKLQAALYHRAFCLPQERLADTGSTSLAELLTGAGMRIAEEEGAWIRGLILAVPMILAGLIGMCLVSFPGACAVLLAAAVLVFLLLTLPGISRRVRSGTADAGKAPDSNLYQILRGVSKIRTAGASNNVLYRYIRGLLDASRPREKRLRFAAAGKGILFSLWLIPPIVVLFAGGIIGGRQTVWQLAGFLAAGMFFCGGTYCLAVLLKRRQQQTAAISGLTEFLSVPGEGVKGAVPQEILGRIDIEHLTFAWPGEDTPVLDDVSVHIAPGEYVGVVGASGSGKSTLMELLLGFRRPDRGRIYYDHRDLEALDRRFLRSEIGIVLQDEHLISGTIADNLAVRDPHMTEDEMWRLLEGVGMKDAVEAMPMGLMTMLDGESPALSGGEKQRLVLARALAAHPKILLLDEATSSVDDITQRRICETIQGLAATRVVIAHRLAALKGCDRILVLRGGRVAAEGRPDELFPDGIMS